MSATECCMGMRGDRANVRSALPGHHRARLLAEQGASSLVLMQARVRVSCASRRAPMVAPCALLARKGLLMQWLEQLSKEEREKKLLEVIDYMADGTIKPPPPSEPSS